MSPDAASNAPAFALRGVEFSYDGLAGEAAALAGVDLAIARGSRVALLGANGSGKSTLLQLLAGLRFADAGSVAFEGEPLTPERLADERFAFAFRRRVGIVFQNPDVQLFNASVEEEIAYGPLQLGWSAERVRVRVAETLAAHDLERLRERAPHRLSGGEKKRVAIAAVLALDPDVVLLDEPTAALDPASGSRILDLLFGWAGSGRTVVLATHELGGLPDIADRAVVFAAGRVVADDTVAAILGDGALLARSGLVHVHRHRHADGAVHAHPHLHGHGHGAAETDGG